jgi:hypothetical protein
MISRGYPANYHSRHPAADLNLNALRQSHDSAEGRACSQHKQAAASRTFAGEPDALKVSHVRTVLQPGKFMTLTWNPGGRDDRLRVEQTRPPDVERAAGGVFIGLYAH